METENVNNRHQSNESESVKDTAYTSEESSSIPFKKPTILVGKIGRLPRKVTLKDVNIETSSNVPENKIDEKSQCGTVSEDVQSENVSSDRTDLPSNLVTQSLENSIQLPYSEPQWSGIPYSPGRSYKFEVLKSGVIVDNVDLLDKSFWVFGRSTLSDICMAHPTVSR